MQTYVILLRAVNVAGHHKIRMSELRDFLVGLGMSNVRTLLQSGNVVFETDRVPAATLEGLLEKDARSRLGLDTDFMVRTRSDWGRIVSGNPFPDEAQRDPSHLLLILFRETPDPGKVSTLRNAIKGRETIETRGREAYVVYPDGIGRSKLTSKLIEAKLGTRGTGRNWNTVLKLDSIASSG